MNSSPFSESETLDFENFAAADRIVVTTNLNRELETLTSSAQIQSVLTFLESHQNGWTVPETGVPIAKLRLNFYQGRKPLGNLGVGKTFLSVHQFGSFWSKASEETERARLLNIMGIQN